MEQLESQIEKARTGDLHAYSQIVRSFQDMAYGYSYSLLGDFHLAEDVAQEAFIDAYRKLSDLRDSAAFPGWFRRILFKHCDRITRAKRLPTTTLDSAEQIPAKDTEPADSSEIGKKVIEAITALPKNQRIATTLFYINGYSQKDISDFLEVPVTTVKKRLHDSRKKLKERMTDMVKDEFKKQGLSTDFTQKVIMLAEIVKNGLGKNFVFHFSNGVRIDTRIEKIVQDEKLFHLLVCGTTDIKCHNGEVLHLDSFVFVPSKLITIIDSSKNLSATPADRVHQSSFEISERNAPKCADAVEYISSPIAAGSLDISPEGGFGFIRIGSEQRSYQYHAPAPDTNEYTWHSSPDDIYISKQQIHDYQLKQGDAVNCTWRHPVGNERYGSIVHILSINGIKIKENQV